MAMKQTKGIKRSETNMTADTSRKANIARVTEEAARKKAAKKPTAMKTSAKSSQAGFAKISGQVAAKNKATALRKAKQKLGVLDATGAAMTKAEKRTMKSFK
jgi:hypothetical protein